MPWTKSERGFLSAARVARLATVDARAVPSNVPVCPLFFDGKLYIGTEANAKKVRNIQAHPNVALAFDDYSENWKQLRGMMIRGRARIIESRGRGSKRFRELRRKFYSKYPQYELSSPLSEGDSSIIEVKPEHKLSWGL